MSRTIDDFRNFFKPDKEKTVFLVKEAVDKALQLVEAGCKNADIILETRVMADPSVEGFMNEYSQVVLNLVQNAKDAIKERKIPLARIEIEIACESGDSVVRVLDNAGGIAQELHDKIFEPYFTTKETGTGIGLYMSKMIIEKNMLGKLTMISTTDGAVFEIRVPECRGGLIPRQ